MFQLVALTVFLAAGGPAHKDPTPPTPPTAPEGPKVAAPEASAKGDSHGHKDGHGPKGEAPKGEAPKGEAAKGQAAKAEGAKGEAHKGDEKGAPRAGGKRIQRIDRATIPPSLTGSALRNEVSQSGGAGEERAAPMTERQRLEQLAAEITRAREALKQDTARLESMLKGGDGRMPVGDPSAPMGAVAPGPAASKEAMKEQILTVSKAMKGMKPEQAAAIVGRLDRVLAAEILRRMKPTDAGAVMGAIKPEVAAELATLIATRKSLIDDKKDGKQ